MVGGVATATINYSHMDPRWLQPPPPPLPPSSEPWTIYDNITIETRHLVNYSWYIHRIFEKKGRLLPSQEEEEEAEEVQLGLREQGL